jgi:hypothetical protein
MGETAELDTAPTFAAMLSVQNGDYTQLLKAATGACPTLNEQTGEFTVADCAGPGPKVGVLSNQGAMKHYYGNFGFRRVKWVQETFDCAKFPIKNDAPPVDIGGAVPYTGYFPIETIANLTNGGRVNFTEAVAVNCANCHGVMNHRAPLFVNFDDQGVYQNQVAVGTPLPGAPLAQLADLLPAGEGPAWVFGVPTPDLAALGTAMAADPGIARCGVARIWNWAMGKADIVELLTEVPIETIQTQVDEFTQSGFKMKDMIYKAFTHADFVQF